MAMSLLKSLMVLGVLAGAVVASQPKCNSLECPDYTVVDKADGYEVRQYTPYLWAKFVESGDSYKAATSAGFSGLFSYINGANSESAKIDMTTPVLTRIVPSQGPVCASNFEVHFWLPSKYQGSTAPPIPTGNATIVRQEDLCVAVKEFGGFTSDDNVVAMAMDLKMEIDGSSYNYTGPTYDVAEYDSPFQLFNRHNEIWLPLESCNTRSNTVA